MIIQSSRWSPNNLLQPTSFDIQPNQVTWKKCTYPMPCEIIPINEIASIKKVIRFFWCDLIIETVGGKEIIGTGFRREEFDRATALLEKYLIEAKERGAHG